MKQKQFVSRVVERIENDPNVVGLAVAGSFITNEMDEFSDVDLILVTKAHVSDDVRKMEAYAKSFGNYLHGFTGEHVGEKRVLICLYDNPLLHVDIKFLVVEEFRKRVENPVIVYDPSLRWRRSLRTPKANGPRLTFSG